jgi:multidrug efflux pump subunit AcrB
VNTARKPCKKKPLRPASATTEYLSADAGRFVLLKILKYDIVRDVAARGGAFGQRHVAEMFTTLNNYYVILEVDPSFQLGPYALNRIYVRSSNGAEVPLVRFVKVVSETAP